MSAEIQKIIRCVNSAKTVVAPTVSGVTSQVSDALEVYKKTRAAQALKTATGAEILESLSSAIKETTKANTPAKISQAEQGFLVKLQNTAGLVASTRQCVVTDETRMRLQQLLQGYTLEVATLKTRINTISNTASDISRIIASL